MPKLLKYSLIAVAALLVLLVAAAAIIAATFNPNDYKPTIIKLVQEKKQRTLSIPGEIKLTFFPRIGADLGKLSISESRSNVEFASVEHAQVSLALLPLFSKQFVVDRLSVDGLRANIQHRKDGGSNFDDLLGKDSAIDAKAEARADSKAATAATPVNLDIGAIAITNGSVNYRDEAANRTVSISKLQLRTGPTADGKKSDIDFSADISGKNPDLGLIIKLKSDFTPDLGRQHFVLNKIDAAINGGAVGFSDIKLTLGGNVDVQAASRQFSLDALALSLDARQGAQALQLKVSAPKLSVTDARVAGDKIAVDAKMTEAARSIEAKFSLPAFEGTAKAFRIPAMALEVNVRQDALSVAARLSGEIDGDMEGMVFRAPKLALTVDGKQGDIAIHSESRIDLLANLKTELIQLALNGKLDTSTLDAKFAMRNFAKPLYTFDVGIGAIDVDRYLGKGEGNAKSAAAPAPAKAGPEKPIDLSALKALNAEGKVKVGSLKVANIKTTNLNMQLHAAGGKLELSPLTASLYGGSVAGALTANASTPPRFAIRQNFSKVNIGPLLKDAIDKDILEGQGNIALDVATTGATVTQLKKDLAGSARVELKGGVLKGINLAAAIRNAQSMLGGGQAGGSSQGTASAQDKTDFSEFGASFKIVNGIAHNDDLVLKSPLIRVGGNGDINIGEDRLDYTVSATVVPTLQGQGGPELQALKGLTVPVKLNGPFAAIGWKIDFAGLASGVAKQKIDEQKDQLKSKLQDQLKDRLKGLLGK